MKTSELIGPALDWAVAKCEGITLSGFKVSKCYRQGADYSFKPNGWYVGGGTEYMPSLHWHDGGPIIEREGINTFKYNKLDEREPDKWGAHKVVPRKAMDNVEYSAALCLDGPTPLTAAMRAFVASKLGDEVEIPSELQP